MEQLKIGVLIDDFKIAKYQAEILEELAAKPWCEITLFIKKQKSFDPFMKHGRFALYRMLRAVDAKVFGKNAPFLAPVSLEQQISDENLYTLQTVESERYDEVAQEDREKIAQRKLDVLLNFGFKQPDAEFLQVAKYGIWALQTLHEPPGFWEVIEDIPVSEVSLVRMGSGLDAGFVLDRFKTVTHQKSMRKNYEQMMWRAHMLVVQNLAKLAIQKEAYFADKPAKTFFNDRFSFSEVYPKKFFDPRFHFADDLAKKAPTNLRMVRAALRLGIKYLKFTVRRFFPMDRWIILFAENRNGKSNPDFGSYKRLPLPSIDYFQADPFIVDEGGKSYLFYEELDYKTLKGYLLVAEYDEKQQTFVNSKEILRKEYHLSYPNIFKVDGTWYMVPETHENRTVDLYEAEDFPYRWKKLRTMLSNTKAVDATLFAHDGKWWMFVSQADKEGFSLNDTLSLYYCDDFRTDAWIPHPENPVITDVTRARPAGQLIEHNGRIFRPAQDCSGIYGRGMVFNEVLVLNETTYKERPAQYIRADFADDLVAVHTFNKSDRFTVIDAIKSR